MDVKDKSERTIAITPSLHKIAIIGGGLGGVTLGFFVNLF